MKITRQIILPLSLSCDLANGNPPETAIRTAVLSIRLGERLGMSEQNLSDLAYTSILRFMGCTSYSSEEANLLGNEILIRRALAHVDSENPWEIMQNLFIKKNSPLTWTGVKNAITQKNYIHKDIAEAHCETASLFAQELGMSQDVQCSLYDFYERWDGKGKPRGISGEEISGYARIIYLCYFLELMQDRMSKKSLLALVKKKMGKQFDPHLCKLLDEDLFSDLNQEKVWGELENSMSTNFNKVSSEKKIAEIFGKMVDLKSKYTMNHSTSVEALSRKMADILNLKSVEKDSLEIASYLKDLGMLSISNLIIEKKSQLTKSEKESIRLHPYTTMRILSGTNLDENVLEIAGSHHEALDGSGYHRSLKGSDITKASRILMVADTIIALQSKRSYRDPYSEPAIKKELINCVKSGKLCKDSVDAGLESLGFYTKKSKPKNTCGLTEREIEVLQKISQGLTNPEIAKELNVSPRTIQHHSIHIYSKIGVSSRAGATLFASKNGIV